MLDIGKICILEYSVWNIIEKYCESFIFVLFLYFEGFGMVIIEVMVCGVFFIVFVCLCGLCDIIENNIDGILVRNGDIIGLVDKICFFMENESVCKEMGICVCYNVECFKIENIVF